ncbi:MAG: hypothetical protein ACHQ0J_12560 [Candidatus Dormibacterales bacterium]
MRTWPPPSAVPLKRRSRRGLITVVAGLVILVLAAVVLLAYAVNHQTPVLSLSSTTVAPGDSLVVSASHLPPNQSGELQLYSQVYVFPFQADGSGQATVSVTVPFDVTAGSHELKVCWSGACHGQAALNVTAPVPSPTPSAFPSPSLPVVTPSPTAARTPTPPTPTLALSSGSVKRGGTLTIYGLNFAPRQTISINFVQSASPKYLTTSTTGPEGSFRTPVIIPSTAALGPASVRACAGSVCAYATFTVLA